MHMYLYIVCENRGQTRRAKKIEKWPANNGVLEYIFRVYKVNEKKEKKKKALLFGLSGAEWVD